MYASKKYIAPKNAVICIKAGAIIKNLMFWTQKRHPFSKTLFFCQTNYETTARFFYAIKKRI